MSETPGQVLGRLLIDHGIGVRFDYSGQDERDAVAAAFLAAMGGGDRCAYCGDGEVVLTPTCVACRDKAERTLP